MEDDLREISSASLEKHLVKNVLLELSEVVTEAAALRDQVQVDNPLLRKAVSVVEDFLREKKRVCYGGMAINAHLPAALKFYDFSKSLPDYDFFSPSPVADGEDLVKRLTSNGFEDVVLRMGVHEGTYKVFANFIGVADISYLPVWMDSILKSRALKDDGILYTDADFLRMNMYLELSRPMGEVERWEKVYLRLLYLNRGSPPHINSCKHAKKRHMNTIPAETHEILIDYLHKTNLIYVGPELRRLYKTPRYKRAAYIEKATSAVVAYAENPAFHIPILRQILHDADPRKLLTIVRWPASGDIVPEIVGIKQDGKLCVLLMSQDYCHAYNQVDLPNKKHLRVAALDTAIVTWYQLSFVRGLEGLVSESIHCFADGLVDISMQTRDKGRAGVFPAFATSCSGHQPSKASLLRAKKVRVEAFKKTRKAQGKSLKKILALNKTARLK